MDVEILIVICSCFILFVVIHLSDGSAEIISFTCTAGPELCKDIFCNTTVTGDNNHQLNCGCFLPRPVYQATLEVWLERKRGKKYVTVINMKEDLRQIVKQTVGSPAMSNLFSASKRFLTGFEYPFQGNMSVRKMPVLLNYASVFMQSSAYRLKMDFSSKQELILRTELDFIIGNSKNKNKKKNTTPKTPNKQ
ncbi:uncharacterized protein LOC129907224 [Episyrphus balteatus]|uniref:uncharacterized protein LOC129907224 n=1 Tax=Episyrphus balteatus TaxID=286459 RepID=UPI00248652D5|nr:uncharacterized protein LOC129907224 [Episyrphus balteatus]